MNIIHLLKIKSDVAYIYESNTLRQGLEKMKRYGYTAIPVITKDGDYAGTVTEGDFLWHIIEKGRGCQCAIADVFSLPQFKMRLRGLPW